MKTRQTTMTVDGLAVEVVRKAMKTLRLTIFPPDGRVRVSAPLRASDAAVRDMVLGRLAWINRHRARIEALPRPATLALESGEPVALLDRLCRLLVVERPGRARVRLLKPAPVSPDVSVAPGLSEGPGILDASDLAGEAVLELCVPPGSGRGERRLALRRWQRRELAARIPALLEKWQPVLGVEAAAWGIRQMRTRWGSCNTRSRRICLNLELISRPERCLEYVVVHELAHLIERGHNARFYAVLDRVLPGWRALREELRSLPLGCEGWEE